MTPPPPAVPSKRTGGSGNRGSGTIANGDVNSMQPGNKSTEGGADKKRMRSRISGNLYHDWGIWLAKFINLLLITAPFVVCWYA